ncbi:MAG: hypothetical protein AAFU33_01280 [Bacteroidota bacterium]
MRFYIIFFILWIPLASLSQVEKIYDKNGQIQAINPINEEGVFDGLGYTFYPSGAVEKEIPYVEGIIQGKEKTFYESGKLKGTLDYKRGKKEGIEQVFFEDGSIKMKQKWEKDLREGSMEVFYPMGDIRIYALMQHDSILFAQYFDTTGKITSERVGFISSAIDTFDLPPVKIYIKEGKSLQSGQANSVHIVQQRIPREFVAYSSRDGLITLSNDPLYPLAITPDEGADTFTVYMRIQVHSMAEHILVRKVVLPVAPAK